MKGEKPNGNESMSANEQTSNKATGKAAAVEQASG